MTTTSAPPARTSPRARTTPTAARRRRGLLALVAVLALAVAMVLSTRFLTPEEVLEVNPPPFDPATFSAEEFPRVVAEVQEQAVDLTTLAVQLAEDPAAAANEYGTTVSGASVYPVTATGTVTSVDDRFMELSVDGMPEGSSVNVPVGDTVNGTPVRDVTGSLTFGDFTDQTQFQSVANEFKSIIQEQVVAPADPPSLVDQRVSVSGAYAPGGPEGSFLVQPVAIEPAP